MKNSAILFVLLFASPFLTAQSCVIENLYTEIASDCYDDGTFDAHLEFDITNGNNNGFDVYVNNEFFQYFPEYPDPFVSLNNVFAGNGSELLIKVQDNDNPNCFATTFLTLPDCPGSCSLDDLTVEFVACNFITGNYTAFVNFTHEYEIFTQFSIYLNDVFYTSWNSSIEMPQIFNFEGATSPDQIDVLKICTNYSQQCCTEFEFQPQNCTTTDCIIDQLYLEERTACDDAGQFYIFPGFTSVNLSDNVNIYINGEDQGQYSSEQFNYEIGPFSGNGNFYEIKICDAIDESCCKTDTIGPLFCQNDDFCFISDLRVNKECFGDGTYNLQVAFEHGFTSGTVNISTSQNYQGAYDVDEQPIILGPFEDGNAIEYMTVVDFADIGCGVYEELNLESCQLDSCALKIISASKFCDGANDFIVLDYIHESNADATTLFYVNDVLVSSNFELNNEVMLTLSGLPIPTNNTYTIIIVEEGNVTCFDEITLCGVSGCDFNCTIDELYVEEECLDDGSFYLNVFASSFFNLEDVLLSGNGTDYGSFDFAEQPFRIGPFSAGDLVDEILVTSATDALCQSCIQFDAVDCGTGFCSFSDPEVYDFICDSLTLTYSMQVEFESQNIGPTFTVTVNGVNQGIFPSGNSLPISLQNIVPRPNTDYDIIEICATNVDDCCLAYEYFSPNCGNIDGCQIDILGAEVICDGPVVYIEMAYNYLNPLSEALFFVNGALYAQSSIAGQQQGIQLGPIPSNPNGEYLVTVSDEEQDDCFAEIGLEHFCADDCFIEAVEAVQECLNDSLYFVYVTFEFGVNTSMVQIIGNGIDHGIYNVLDQPIEIGPFTSTDLISDFLVLDTQHDCQGEAILLVEDCGDDGLCDIDILGAEVICDGPVVYIEVAYNYLNPFSEAHFYVNGELYAQSGVAGQQLDIQLGPIPSNPDGIYNITLLDAEQDNCLALLSIINFCSEDCIIGEIIAEQDCLDDGTYSVFLYYEHLNTSGAVTVRGNGRLYGTFGNNEQIILGPFSDNDIVNEFVLIDSEMEDCISEIEVEFEDCETLSDCGLSDLVVDIIECDPSIGSYTMNVNFDYEIVDATDFVVWVNNEFYDEFSFDENPPFLVENVVPRPDSEFDIIQVCLMDSTDCCIILEYLQPECLEPEECEISNIIVDHDCLDGGSYYLYVSFDHLNTSEFVAIRGNGNTYGAFNVFEQPIQLGPIQPGQIITELAINDLEIDCRGVIEFDPIECEETGPCEIGAPDVQIECNPDGTFFAYLTISYANISNFVNIRGNGVNYGAFNVDEQPFQIGPLLGDGTTFYEFIVIDAEDEDCQNFVEYGAVACEEEEGCAIFDVNILEVECDEATNTYDALIDFGFINPTNDFFDVWVNDEYLDFFSFSDQPPFEITNISPRENSDFDIIKICINDDPDCCVEFEYLQPSCLDVTNNDNQPNIINVDIEPLDCDETTGTYSLRLDFDTENYASTSFTLWINGVEMPRVSMTELPVIYTGITPQDSTDLDALKICIGEQNEFCIEMEYDQPDCLNTAIVNVDDFEQVKLYPNPTNNFVNLENLPAFVITVQVIDNLGRQRMTITDNLSRINVLNLEKGIYFVKLVTKDNYIYSLKFIKN